MKKKETMRARLGTAGRLAGGLLAGLLAMTAVWANETTWIGPAEGGAWHNVQNWDNGVPTADSTVYIAVKGDMTIAPAAQQNATLLRLRATGEGTLTIPHTGNGLYFGKDADGRCGVDISEDVVCVVLTTFQSASLDLLPHFVKAGAGTLTLGDGTTNHGFGRNNGWKFAGVDVAAGTLRIHYQSHTDAFDPGKPAILHIGPRATLDVQALNWLVNWGRLDVAAGGLANLNNMQDLIGGLSGDGVVSNVNELTCSLQDGPYLFTGRIYGTSRILLHPHIPEASSNSTAKVACTVEQGRFIVGPEAIANINAVHIPDEAVGYPQALQFAPGYPEGTVFAAKKITYPDALALCLEDAEGRPTPPARGRPPAAARSSMPRKRCTRRTRSSRTRARSSPRGRARRFSSGTGATPLRTPSSPRAKSGSPTAGRSPRTTSRRSSCRVSRGAAPSTSAPPRTGRAATRSRSTTSPSRTARSPPRVHSRSSSSTAASPRTSPSTRTGRRARSSRYTAASSTSAAAQCPAGRSVPSTRRAATS